MKRSLYIVTVVVVIVGVILIGYWFASRQGGETPGGAPSGGLPPAATGQPPARTSTSSNSGSGRLSDLTSAALTREAILDYFVESNEVVRAVQEDGSIVEIAKSVTTSVASSTGTFIAASLSFDGSKVLFTTIGSNVLSFTVFDIAHRSWSYLPVGTTAAVWSPTSATIAYLSRGSAAGTLQTLALLDTNAPNAKPKALSQLRFEDVVLAWPAADRIVLAEKPSAYAPTDAWVFDVKKKLLSPLATGETGLAALLDPYSNGSLVFTSTYPNRGGALTLRDPAKTPITLSFTTIPSKCVFFTPQPQGTSTTAFNRSTLTCAIPRDQDELSRSTLPDDYYKKRLFTRDALYEINTTTGALTLILDNASRSFDAELLKIFSGKLFFVNRYDRKLYSVTLPPGALQ